MRKRLLFLLTILLPFIGNSQNLITWELSAAAGNQVSSNSTTSATGIGTGVLSRGAGITAASAGGSMSSNGWFNTNGATTTITDAINNNEYYEFSLPVNSGFTATVTAIKVVMRASSSGPNTVQLRSSADNYATAIGSTATITSTTASALFTFTPSTSIVSSTNLTFRLYGYGTGVSATSATTGTCRIGSSAVAADNDIIIEGTAANNSSTNLSINDVTLDEGNTGTTNFVFTVLLSNPAPAGGVTFNIQTADNTATIANNDYNSNSLTNQTIPQGSTTYSFTAVVNGDAMAEPNETFFVNITNVVGTGITLTDGQGQGTITNDDFALTLIHDIQGAGNTSPIVGASVITEGVVTAVKSNGFFIQEPDATVDADPNTSEGILVFTSSAPPAAAAVGNRVRVAGTVIEFVPSADPNSPSITEITSPTVTQLSTGNPLPTPVVLTATSSTPSGGIYQLEKYEGMRVSASSLTVVAPTQGSISEANATSTSNGVFHTVVTGVARPFRETGILEPNPAPSGGGSIPPIPRFDGNPEMIRVDSDGQTGAIALNVAAGQTLTNVVGVLDFGFRFYSILPDASSPPTVSGTISPTPISTKSSTQFTVGAFNLQRFYDTVDDAGISDVALTTTAFNNRLNKASLAIRNVLKFPDILAVVEMENLTTLQSLATKISNDAIANSQPDPQYASYLVEGNDVGGIDVGFLVKGGGSVSVVEVVQELKNTLFVNANSSTEILNDRPPLRLKAIVNHSSGKTFPITVIANHLRSLGSVDDESAGSNGWSTAGARVRAKRQKQAEDLANLIQGIQTTNPNEKIVLVGDFNAFEFNDGLVDVINVIKGTPTPDNQTAVTGDGVDLVNPDFVTPPITDSPYSYTFDGSAQTLDHVIVSSNLSNFIDKIEHGRINADFPETDRNNSTTPNRISDHDPVVATINFCPPSNSFIATSVTVSATSVCVGGSINLSGNCTTGTLTWYNQATGGTALGTGNGLSQSPASNTTYYAACEDGICISDRVATVEVTTFAFSPPVAGSNAPVCVGNTLNLNVSPAANSYAWTGPNSFSSTEQNPMIANVTPDASGVYSVTVTTLNGCSATATTSATISVLPISNPSSNSPVCLGNTLNLSSTTSSSYLWTGPNSFSSTEQNPSITSVTANVGGIYTITQTNSAGCTASATVNVMLNSVPIPTIGSNSPVCSGLTLNLSSGGGNSYTWTGPNSFSSTEQNPSVLNVTAAASGVYTVTVISLEGCTATTTTSVTINPTPNPTAGSNSPLCIGATLNLTSSSGDSFIWAGPNSFSSSMQNPSIIGATSAASGIYTVTITNNTGCSASATTEVSVNSLAPIPITAPISLCQNSVAVSLTATALSNHTLVWWETSSSGGISSSTAPIPSTLTLGSTTYYVSQINNLSGCESPRASLTVTVEQAISYNRAPAFANLKNVCENGNTTISLNNSLQGTGLSYQWQVFSGGSFTNLSNNSNYAGVSSNTLTINNITGSFDNNEYRCIISNLCGTLIADTTKLRVVFLPQITTQPIGQTVCVGNETTLSVVVAGSSLVFQWQVNTGSGFTNIVNNTNYSGVNSGSLKISSIPNSFNNYQYRCVVSNNCSSTNSDASTLVVDPTITILNQPMNRAVCQNSNASFTVTAVHLGAGVINYQWQISYDYGLTYSNLTNGVGIAGANSATLTLSNIQFSMNNARLRCVMNGYCQSFGAALTVTSVATVVSQPNNVSICEGNIASFSIIAEGIGLNYRWQVNSGSGFVNLYDGGIYQGATSNTLQVIGATTAENNYQYRCVVTGSSSCDVVPSTSNPAILTVSISALAQTVLASSPINTLPSVVYQAVGYVLGINTISPPANVKYQAGNAIILNPGFKVNQGAVFEANIQNPCANNRSSLPEFIKK